jgi:type I restriction enzyme S subunit
MTDGYPVCRLGEVASVQGGFAFKSGDFTETGVPVLKIKNVRLREVDTTEPAYVDQSVAKETARYFCKTGDLLISMTGSGPQAPNSVVGRVARFAGPSDRYLINQRVGRLVNKAPDKLDQRYLFYVLAQDETLWKLVAVATGSANQANISGSQIESLEVPLPPLAEQKAIAAVLGALDDKIELNRRMNATLEAMARALFQSWFVDFDPVRAKLDGSPPAALDPSTAALFPDSFQESTLGPIPHGWEVSPLSEKIQLFSGGTPKTSEPTYWDGDIPWYSVSDAPSETDVWVIHTDKHVTKLGIANSAAQVFPEKTTIISARGTVGKLALTAVPMAMNQSCYGVRGITGYGDYFTYYSLREATTQLQQRTHGTVFDTITTETFKTLDCIFPTPKITAAFDTLVEPMLGRIRANLLQSRTLATLRDTLLPKLLSGELQLPANNL